MTPEVVNSDSRGYTPDMLVRLPLSFLRLPLSFLRLPSSFSRLLSPFSRLPSPFSRLPSPFFRLPSPLVRLPAIVAFVCTYVLLSLVIVGCCAHRFDRPVDGLTQLQGADGSQRTLGAALHSRVVAYAQKTQTIAYTTRMEHYGPDGVVKGKVDVLGKRPGKFRFEALTPSDDTLAVLVSDGTRFMSHQRGQSICYAGPACTENVSRLIPLPFQGEQLFDLLVGGVPLLKSEAPVGRWNDCEGVYELLLTRDEWREIVWLRPDIHAPIRVVMTRAGVEQFRIEYDDFDQIDGVQQAQLMRYVSEIRDVDLTMSIRDAERNGIDSEGTLFKVECPAGTERRELPCR